MNTEFAQKVAKFIELAHASTQATNAELAKRDQAAQDFAKNASNAAEDLVAHKLVDVSQQARLAEKLTDPNYVLSQMLKLAKAQPKETAAPRLGTLVDSGVSTKTASAKSPKQRDLDFVKQLGLSAEFA